MEKLKKIFDILWEIIIFYVFIVTMFISVGIVYLIPTIGAIALTGAVGIVTIIHFDAYLKERK